MAALVAFVGELEDALAVHDAALGTAYKAKFRSLDSTLRANPDLVRTVMSGGLTVTEMVTSEASDMVSSEERERLRKVRQDAIDRTRSDWDRAKQLASGKDGSHTCGRCRSKKTTFYQLQTRSADEPMTTFCTCLKCNHRWKY